MTGRVYFLRREGEAGPVKIGYSRTPELRRDSFQPWCPWPVELAATVIGPPELEYRFHTRFIADRIHFEWFRGSPALCVAIDAIQRGAFDLQSLPAPRRLPRQDGERRWSPETRRKALWSMRISRLRSRGVEVPAAVRMACIRLTCGPYSSSYSPVPDPADMRLVDDYLAEHWQPASRRRAA